MSPPPPAAGTIQAAAHAVVEYALISLQEQFLRWDKDVNMHVAEFVWNAGGVHLESCAFHAPGPDLGDLVRTLARARRSRWGDEEVLLIDLDVRHEAGEIVFTFELSWDEGETFQACEIAVDSHVAGPAVMN